MVDLLSQDHDLVVRYQGGANAGHTVVVGDEVYKLHLIPSGIIHEKVTNVIAPGVVINPETILTEIQSLLDRGMKLEGRLLMSQRAHVVCPWHVEEDKLDESREDNQENIGTTLRGIGPCYRDKVGRKYAIRLIDLIQDDLPEKVQRIVEYKQKVLNALSNDPPQLDAAKIAESLASQGQQLKPFYCGYQPSGHRRSRAGQVHFI